jgi:alkylation response protein AidB-like acyl-CoA dehydrogenase
MAPHLDEPAAAAGARLPPPSPPCRIRSDAEALTAARAVARIFAAGAAERDRDRRLPWAEIAAFTESGLGGITVPRAYGGAEVSYATLAEVFAILAAADGSAAQIHQNQFGVLALVAVAASPAQQTRIYRDVLAGRRIGNAGPARNGKAITRVDTRLTSGPEGQRLSGTRFYATGALFAHWIPTRAVGSDGGPLLVFVRRDAPGVRVVDDWQGFGQRTTASGSVIFENAPVEADLTIDLALLAEHPGLFGPVSQLIHAAIDAGLARGAAEAALDVLRTRTRPYPFAAGTVAEDPHILGEVGRLTVDLHAAEEVLARGRPDAGPDRRRARLRPERGRGLGRGGAGQDPHHRDRPRSLRAAARARRRLGDPRRVQSRPVLARRPGPHPARPRTLEVPPRRQPRPERRAAGPAPVELTPCVPRALPMTRRFGTKRGSPLSRRGRPVSSPR